MNGEIRFEHVNVLYGDEKSFVTAIDDLNLELAPNQIHAIVGVSGSGKSTLLKCLTDNLVYEGKIFLNGEDLSKIPFNKRKVSYLNQDLIVYPHLNVYDNIIFPLKASKMPHDEADQRVKKVARDLGIGLFLTRKPKYLSYGQASRVALARALVKPADLYLFDEPTQSLDPERADAIVALIKKHLKEEGKTALYVTHRIKEALMIADDIIVIDEGKLIGQFSPKEFMASAKPAVISLRKEIEFSWRAEE